MNSCFTKSMPNLLELVHGKLSFMTSVVGPVAVGGSDLRQVFGFKNKNHQNLNQQNP